jgi:hypothetical protein
MPKQYLLVMSDLQQSHSAHRNFAFLIFELAKFLEAVTKRMESCLTSKKNINVSKRSIKATAHSSCPIRGTRALRVC